MIVDDHWGGRHHLCWFEMEVKGGDHCVGLHFYWFGTVQVGQLRPHFLSGLVIQSDKLWSSVASVADILHQPAR